MRREDVSVSAPDPASEQLYDELMGRHGLCMRLFVLRPYTPVEQVRKELAGYSTRTVAGRLGAGALLMLTLS